MKQLNYYRITAKLFLFFYKAKHYLLILDACKVITFYPDPLKTSLPFLLTVIASKQTDLFSKVGPLYGDDFY